MEDEQRVALDRLVMQYELRYHALGPKRVAFDLGLIDLERQIRKCTAECNDVMIKCPRVVGGRWFFGLHD